MPKECQGFVIGSPPGGRKAGEERGRKAGEVFGLLPNVLPSRHNVFLEKESELCRLETGYLMMLPGWLAGRCPP